MYFYPFETSYKCGYMQLERECPVRFSPDIPGEDSAFLLRIIRRRSFERDVLAAENPNPDPHERPREQNAPLRNFLLDAKNAFLQFVPGVDLNCHDVSIKSIPYQDSGLCFPDPLSSCFR